jgi:hypothetical protein
MRNQDRLSLKSGQLKVKTSLSLSKTKPLKEKKIQKLQKSLEKIEESKKSPVRPAPGRTKPESQVDLHNKLQLWLIPARVAYFLNGLYFLSFSVIAFIGLFSSFNIIKPFFTLPFDTSFSSFFLLEIAAVFSFMVSLLYFHAARSPRRYRWFYFLLILAYFPYHFASNYQKMQIELSQDFQNYLYFDTIIMAAFWICFLVSLYPYLKQKSQP